MHAAFSSDHCSNSRYFTALQQTTAQYQHGLLQFVLYHIVLPFHGNFSRSDDVHSANTFFAKAVEADAIVLGLGTTCKPLLQVCELHLGQVALEYAVLNAGPVSLEHLRYPTAPSIIGNIIRNNDEHVKLRCEHKVNRRQGESGNGRSSLFSPSPFPLFTVSSIRFFHPNQPLFWITDHYDKLRKDLLISFFQQGGLLVNVLTRK